MQACWQSIARAISKLANVSFEQTLNRLMVHILSQTPHDSLLLLVSSLWIIEMRHGGWQIGNDIAALQEYKWEAMEAADIVFFPSVWFGIREVLSLMLILQQQVNSSGFISLQNDKSNRFMFRPWLPLWHIKLDVLTSIKLSFNKKVSKQAILKLTKCWTEAISQVEILLTKTD